MQLQAQGELQRTDQPLDLALDGDGLLLVRDKSGTLGGVRTGAFHLTKEGRLQDAKGLTLQGWTLPSGTPEGGEATSPAFLGSLGDLENIQLIKPEPLAESTPPEEPDPSNLYGTGWTTKKEADGVYSFHSSANFPERAQEGIRVLRTLVDSLGNEHAVNVELWKNTGATVSLLPDPYNANPSISATYHHRADGSYSTSSHEIGTSYVFDEETGRATITFEDTGATLTLDISDIQATDGGGIPAVEPGGTLSWNFPPMIFEEGTWYVYQNLEVVHSSYGGFSATLKVEKNADGSFRGELYEYNGIFEIEFHFDEDGRVSDHMFTWHAQGDSDPSVGVKQAGSLAEVHCIDRGTDHGTFNVDLSAIRILNRTGADLVVNGSTIKPATSFEGTGSARTASGTAPSGDSSAMVSPSSLSIDENGVLKRLKDDGDWEPVYLLACGQFTAMNSAEERNGVYYATPASGALRTGVSGKDGMGTITSGTLERSTTDLAHELSEMIRAQHAYAANTKVLSTIEDMLTELERL
jgi:flagellar hook-basal body protein